MPTHLSNTYPLHTIRCILHMSAVPHCKPIRYEPHAPTSVTLQHICHTIIRSTPAHAHLAHCISAAHTSAAEGVHTCPLHTHTHTHTHVSTHCQHTSHIRRHDYIPARPSAHTSAHTSAHMSAHTSTHVLISPTQFRSCSPTQFR